MKKILILIFLNVFATQIYSQNPCDSLFSVDLEISPPSNCFTNDGSINTILTSGVEPFVYKWNNNSFDANITDLYQGVYSVIVIDSNDCQVSATVTLQTNEGNFPNADVSSEDISCFGASDGSISLEIQNLELGSNPAGIVYANSFYEAGVNGLQFNSYYESSCGFGFYHQGFYPGQNVFQQSNGGIGQSMGNLNFEYEGPITRHQCGVSTTTDFSGVEYVTGNSWTQQSIVAQSYGTNSNGAITGCDNVLMNVVWPQSGSIDGSAFDTLNLKIYHELNNDNWSGNHTATIAISPDLGETFLLVESFSDNRCGWNEYEITNPNAISSTMWIVFQYEAPTASGRWSISEVVLESPGSSFYSSSISWESDLILDDNTTASSLPEGNYSYLITDEISGCKSEGWLDILEPNQLNFELNILDASCSTCNDGEINIVTDESYNIEWDNEIDLNALIPGEYEILISDSNGCYIDSVILINPLPSWNCINASCIDPGNAEGTYSNLEECEANCTVVIEDSWSCINDACVDPMDGSGVYSSLNDCEQECTDVSSINENINDVNIFPNPSSNIFNLEFNSDYESEISVTNVLGEQVYFESVQSVGKFNTQIDLSNFSKGIYNLTIKNSDGLSNHKLILQ